MFHRVPITNGPKRDSFEEYENEHGTLSGHKGSYGGHILQPTNGLDDEVPLKFEATVVSGRWVDRDVGFLELIIRTDIEEAPGAMLLFDSETGQGRFDSIPI